MPTKIEWCDETWSPVTGCSKISEGCRNCYAERMSKRLRGRCGYSEDNPFQVTYHRNRLEQPFRWRNSKRIFVNSMGDLFHRDVDSNYIAAIFGVMAANPQHQFMVLTKRPQRMIEWFKEIKRPLTDYITGNFEPAYPSLECAAALLAEEAKHHIDGASGPIHCKWGPEPDAPWPLKNVSIGVSVENQDTADERIPLLMQCQAAVRFVSAEPLLGPIDLAFPGTVPKQWGYGYRSVGDLIHSVIVGGESGPGARFMHPSWARSIRDQCVEAKIPFFFKSWGDWQNGSDFQRPKLNRIVLNNGKVVLPDQESIKKMHKELGHAHWGNFEAHHMARVGKKHSGNELDGRTWEELPDV